MSRVWHGALAVIAWGGALLLQFYLSFTLEEGGGIHAVFITLSYFTILSNILVAVVATALAVDPRRDSAAFRWLRLGGLVQITITGLVYVAVLAPLLTPADQPQGLGAVANYCQHYIVPAMAVIGWLLFGPRRRITWTVVPTVLIIPTIWLGYTMIHGVLDPRSFLNEKSYPYPFLDVDKLGYGGVAGNTVVIAIAGVLFGLAFLGLERLVSPAPESGQQEPDQPPSGSVPRQADAPLRQQQTDPA